MIPLRLTLRDFLSYGDPEPIDFTSFDVACLSGHNGAGKSALLDALTWSLFGAARGCEGGQNQDRLVRDGTDEAFVELDFRLGGATYRVIRRRNRAGRSDLQFRVADGEGWTNIAGETARETQARIESTLRMDYKTFTASAFFVQGRAEDFLARMRPEERKEVFARLLDIGSYERLEDAARARARDAESRRKQAAQRVEELTAVASEAAALDQQLAAAQAQVAASVAAVQKAEELAEAKREAVVELEKLAARLEAERKAFARLRANLADAQQTAAERRSELEHLDVLLARSDEIEAGLREAEALRSEDEQARERQQRAAHVESRLAALNEQIEGERKALSVGVRERTNQLESARRELTAIQKAEAALAELESSLAASEDPKGAIEETRRLADDARAADARFEEELRGITARLAELDERSALLHTEGATCPVCGGSLDGAHRKRAAAALSQEASELKQRAQDAHAARDTARKELKRCTEELRRLEQALAERERLIANREGMRARTERAGTLAAELRELEAALADDSRLLADDEVAPEQRAEAERLVVELRDLYDPAAHRALRARLEALAPYAELAGRHAQADARRRAIATELETLDERIVALAAGRAEHEAATSALEAQTEGLEGAARSLKDAERDLAQKRAEATAAQTEAARIAERRAAVQTAVEERGRAAAAELELAAEHRRYRRLTEAFGRGGIPDLIIDNARPDLENEANEILGRLTDYEMSVYFEMQREMRSGRSKETFDVLVRHDGGLRDFAMFSGGEAFRIAFAVRLALSKLLVRRAGARLETLVIDEGFGTQDPQGRERVVEAINLARQEFAKVLVITHLDDLKDHFSAQLQVSRDPDRGSVVEVVRP